MADLKAKFEDGKELFVDPWRQDFCIPSAPKSQAPEKKFYQPVVVVVRRAEDKVLIKPGTIRRSPKKLP